MISIIRTSIHTDAIYELSAPIVDCVHFETQVYQTEDDLNPIQYNLIKQNATNAASLEFEILKEFEDQIPFSELPPTVKYRIIVTEYSNIDNEYIPVSQSVILDTTDLL